MAEPMMKGVMIYHMKKVIREDLGEEFLKKMTAQCPPDVHEIMEAAIVSTEWYPERVAAEFIRSGAILLGPEKMKAFVRKVARNELNSILRLILHIFSSPETLSKNNPTLWHRLHDSGEMVILNLEKGRKKTEIRDFDFINKEYMDAFVEYHCGLLDAVGARDAKGVIRKVGPKRYLLEFWWK